jgi:hypothetical protein
MPYLTASCQLMPVGKPLRRKIVQLLLNTLFFLRIKDTIGLIDPDPGIFRNIHLQKYSFFSLAIVGSDSFDLKALTW